MTTQQTRELPPVTVTIYRRGVKGLVFPEERLNENVTAETAATFALRSPGVLAWMDRIAGWFLLGFLADLAVTLILTALAYRDGVGQSEISIGWMVAAVIALTCLAAAWSLHDHGLRADVADMEAAADRAAPYLDALPHRTHSWAPDHFRDLCHQLQQDRDGAGYTPERETLLFNALAALGAYRRLADPDPTGKRIAAFAADDSDPAVKQVAREYQEHQDTLAKAQAAAETAVDLFWREVVKDQVTAAARRRVAAGDTGKDRVNA